MFAYDSKPMEHPKKMTHFEACSQTCGGLCATTDDNVKYAQTLTRNLYAAAKDWKAEFPVFLGFEVNVGAGSTFGYAFLGRLVGLGSLAFLSKAVVSHGASDSAELVLEVARAGATPTSYPMTSQRFFLQFLNEAARASNVDIELLESVKVQRWNCKPDYTADRFRITLTDVHTEIALSCMTRVAIRKRKTIDKGELPFGLVPSRAAAPMAKKNKDGQACGSFAA